MLGQHTYHNRALEHIDMLQKLFPFSRQQECRINRGVRTYPGETGKSAVGDDEWLEIKNRSFSLLPVVRSMIGMYRQGNILGMTELCKRFCEVYYGPGDMVERKVYRSLIDAEAVPRSMGS